MTVQEDGWFLVDEVRRRAADRPVGTPWMANEIVAAIERANPHSGDHERFQKRFEWSAATTPQRTRRPTQEGD